MNGIQLRTKIPEAATNVLADCIDCISLWWDKQHKMYKILDYVYRKWYNNPT